MLYQPVSIEGRERIQNKPLSLPLDGIVDEAADLYYLEPGHWYVIKDSALVNTNWNDQFPCNRPYNAISGISAYSGAAVNQADASVLLHGGGHVATSFNGILAFDLDTLSWKCIEEGTVGGLQDEWAAGKVVYIDNRLIVKLNDRLFEFKCTWNWSQNYGGTTGITEPDWKKASNPGNIIKEDNNQIAWTNQGIIGWQPNHTYKSGQRIIGDVGYHTQLAYFAWGDGKTSLDFFRCMGKGGRSGEKEPDWSQADEYSETIVDGDIIWQNMGVIFYLSHNHLFENGAYPWEDKKGSVHSFSHLSFSENMNALVASPVSYSWYPSGTGFINDHPWIYELDQDRWVELKIDSEMNRLGAVNISTSAIDQKRNIVWFYRKEGKSGPRLWSLNLKSETWNPRGGASSYLGNGTMAVVNPDRDELVLFGTDNQRETYSVYNIAPENFDKKGYAKRLYFYKEGEMENLQGEIFNMCNHWGLIIITRFMIGLRM